MTDLKKAAQQALEALEYKGNIYHMDCPSEAAITALKAALAQQEQGPAAWTDRELELIDGMIEVQLRHAAQCDGIANRTMAEKQKGWDMERVALLHKIKSISPRRETEQEPVAWISVTDALPKSGVTVLACYRNRLGKLRRIRAHWIAAKTVEANTEDWDQCSEYDEATDTYYVTEGWFECIDNWGDYSAVAVSEGDVTHWMPLPEAPRKEEA